MYENISQKTLQSSPKYLGGNLILVMLKKHVFSCFTTDNSLWICINFKMKYLTNQVKIKDVWACTRFMMFVEYNTGWRSLCVVLIMGVISKETGTDVERWSWHKDFRQPLSRQSDKNTKYNTVVREILHMLAILLNYKK